MITDKEIEEYNKRKLTREELLEIIEDAVALETNWHNRDSAVAHRQLGELWVLLKAGCYFTIDTKGDKDTLWVSVIYKGFEAFESGSEFTEHDTFYMPTRERVRKAGGGDWY